MILAQVALEGWRDKRRNDHHKRPQNLKVVYGVQTRNFPLDSDCDVQARPTRHLKVKAEQLQGLNLVFFVVLLVILTLELEDLDHAL